MDRDYIRFIHEDDVSFFDIIMGGGGHALHRAFHQIFLHVSDILRVYYLQAASRRMKRAIQHLLIEFVRVHGGRFIRRVNAAYFIEINDDAALLKKAARALRTNRTNRIP